MRCKPGRPGWCGGEQVSTCVEAGAVAAAWGAAGSLQQQSGIPHLPPSPFLANGIPCVVMILAVRGTSMKHSAWRFQGFREELTKSAHYSWRNYSMYISSLFWVQFCHVKKKHGWCCCLSYVLNTDLLLFSPMAKSGLAACSLWGCTVTSSLIQEGLCPFALMEMVNCFSACETVPSRQWGDLPSVGHKYQGAPKMNFNFSLCYSLCEWFLYFYIVFI